jgi:MFS transporter, putative metabolite:H+ symporter
LRAGAGGRCSASAFLPAALLFFVRRYMPESVRYLLSKGRIDAAEKTVEEIEIKALGNIHPEVGTEVKVTVAELLAPGRIKNTLLLWVVSFGFLWASNGILFMLPTILQQRGFPLTQAITFQLVQAITRWSAIQPAVF